MTFTTFLSCPVAMLVFLSTMFFSSLALADSSGGQFYNIGIEAQGSQVLAPSEHGGQSDGQSEQQSEGAIEFEKDVEEALDFTNLYSNLSRIDSKFDALRLYRWKSPILEQEIPPPRV